MSGTNSLCVGGVASGATIGPVYQTACGFGYTGYGTESDQQITVQSSSTFSNMGLNCLSQFGSTPATFRKGGVNGNQTVTQATNGDTWISDATHSDAVVAGNLIGFIWGSAMAITTMRGFSFQQHATTPTVLYAMGAYATPPAGLPFLATTSYCGIIGGSSGGTLGNTDGNKTRIEASGSLAKLGINITGGSAGTVTVTCFNNGAGGNQTVSVASGTGFFQDTTHSDAITAGTDLSTTYVSTNASGKWTIISYEFAGKTSNHEIGSSSDNGLAGIGGGYFYGFGGSGQQSSTTESEEYFVQPYALTARGLRARSTTGGTPTTTIKFRKNSADGNELVNFVLTSGLVIDATHTDSVSATDTFGYTNTGDVTISSVLISVDDGSADTETGAGAIGLNIAVAGAGTGVFDSIGAIGLNIAIAGVGTNIVPAAGAVSLNIAVAAAATGIEGSSGAIGLHIEVAAVPKYTFPAVGAIGLNIAVAGAGTNASISPGGGDVPLDVKDWKRRYGRWKEIEEELIAAEEARRNKIRAGVVDAYERSVEGKTDPEPETEPEPFKFPEIPRQYSSRELQGLVHTLSIRKHSPSNHDENDDEEALLLL